MFSNLHKLANVSSAGKILPFIYFDIVGCEIFNSFAIFVCVIPLWRMASVIRSLICLGVIMCEPHKKTIYNIPITIIFNLTYD